MELTIVRPMSSQTIEINWLEAHTEQGNYVIMPGHSPMVILLAPNKELSLELEDLTRTQMSIPGGILQVTRTAVTLLITHE
jgi:F0F1-type ATP synthase epsilon subunit